MVIDFHTHTFPDSIAEKTIKFLAEKGKVKPYLNGTLADLKASMKRCSVDWSVILPVATVPKQISSINRLAAELSGKDGIIYAGAMHPDCENVDEALDFIKNAGLFGIKLHPDYQDAYFDDPRYIRIMEAAAKRGLYVVTHAGLDTGYPDDIHCTPDHVLRVLDALKGVIDDKLILAHLGGWSGGAEVLEKLVGKPVYMDTSFVLGKNPDCWKVIRAHGVEKILFATDSPWADQKEFIDLLGYLGFSESEKAMIYGENAVKLLKSTGVEIQPVTV